MKSFTDFLAESFDTPYPWRIRLKLPSIVRYQATVPVGNEKRTLEINFDVTRRSHSALRAPEDRNTSPDHEVSLSFYVNLEMMTTGDSQGTKFRIFATVLACARDYIKKYRPAKIHFSAAKFDTGSGPANWAAGRGPAPQLSRSDLYRRLITRFADSAGYTLGKVKSRAAEDDFTLVRK